MDNDRSNIFKTSANILLISIGGKHLTLNARAVMNTYDYRLNHERYVKNDAKNIDTLPRVSNFKFQKNADDCNWTRTHNNLVHNRTLNHLAKLAKSLSCVVSTYLYGAFDCMFLSCHVRFSE